MFRTLLVSFCFIYLKLNFIETLSSTSVAEFSESQKWFSKAFVTINSVTIVLELSSDLRADVRSFLLSRRYIVSNWRSIRSHHHRAGCIKWNVWRERSTLLRFQLISHAMRRKRRVRGSCLRGKGVRFIICDNLCKYTERWSKRACLSPPPSSTSIFLRVIRLLSLLGCSSVSGKSTYMNFDNIYNIYSRHIKKKGPLRLWNGTIFDKQLEYTLLLANWGHLLFEYSWTSLLSSQLCKHNEIFTCDDYRELGLDSISLYLFHWLWRWGKVMVRWTIN